MKTERRRVVSQPPNDNHGVFVKVSYGRIICAWHPFPNSTVAWGCCECPWDEEQVTVENVDGVWYWVRKP